MNRNKNYAFIDGNNLYLGAKSQGIKLDYRKLRLCLTNKFSVAKAFIFIGYDPERTGLYSALYNAGFTLVHKPTVKYYSSLFQPIGKYILPLQQIASKVQTGKQQKCRHLRSARNLRLVRLGD